MSGESTTVQPEAPKLSAGQRAAVIAAIAILSGVAAWLVTGCNRDDTSSVTSVPTAMASGDSRIVGEGELGGLAAEVGHVVFWAGPLPGTQVEFSADENGNVHLRYLTDGAEAGDPTQSFLNIGSYPFAGAYEATRKLSERPGLVKVTEHGGVGFYDPANPYSVIIAWREYPDLQVEVYDPEKNRALEVVRSGDIVPVS